MLVLLLALALYKLTFGLLTPKQQGQGNVYDMEPDSENSSSHFGEYKLPVLPKW